MTGDEIAKTREHRIGPKKLVPASGSALDLLRGHIMRTECSLEALRIFGASVKESQTSVEASADNDTLTLSAEFYSALCYMFPETEPLGIKPIKSCQPDTGAQNATACDKPTSEPKASSLYDFLSSSLDHSNILYIPNENQTISERCKSYLDDYPEDRLSVLAHLIATPAAAVKHYGLPDYLADALAISIMDSEDSTIETSPASMLTREALLSTFLLFYLRDAAEHAMLAECVYTLVEGTTAQAQLFAKSNAVPAVLEDAYHALLQCRAPVCSPFPRLPMCAVHMESYTHFPVNAEAYAETCLHVSLLNLISALLYRPDEACYTICKGDKRPLATFFRSVRCPNEISLSEWQRWSQLIREVYPVPIPARCLEDTSLTMYHATMICRALLNRSISDYTTANQHAKEAVCALEEAIRAINPSATVRITQEKFLSVGTLDHYDTTSQFYIQIQSPHLLVYPHMQRHICMHIYPDDISVTDIIAFTDTHKQFVNLGLDLPSSQINKYYTRMHQALVKISNYDNITSLTSWDPLHILFTHTLLDRSTSPLFLLSSLFETPSVAQPFLRELAKYVLSRYSYLEEYTLTCFLRMPDMLGELIEHVPHNAVALWVFALHNAQDVERDRIRSMYDTATSHWTDARGTACRELMGLMRAGTGPEGACAGSLIAADCKKHRNDQRLSDSARDGAAYPARTSYSFSEELAVQRSSLIVNFLLQFGAAKHVGSILYFLERLDLLSFLSIDKRRCRALHHDLPYFISSDAREILANYAAILSPKQHIALLFQLIMGDFTPHSQALDTARTEHLRFVRPFLLIRPLFNASDKVGAEEHKIQAFIDTVRKLTTLENEVLQDGGSDSCASILDSNDQAAALVAMTAQRYVAAQTAEGGQTANGEAHAGAGATAHSIAADIHEHAEQHKQTNPGPRAGILESRSLFAHHIKLLLHYMIMTSSDMDDSRKTAMLKEVSFLFLEGVPSESTCLSAFETQALFKECLVGAYRAVKWLFQQNELQAHSD